MLVVGLRQQVYVLLILLFSLRLGLLVDCLVLMLRVAYSAVIE